MDIRQERIGSGDEKRQGLFPLGCEHRVRGPIQVPKMMKAGGYACPICKALKIQNNMGNVLQHVHAKHKEKQDPRIKQMSEAAAQRVEDIDNVYQNPLQLHDSRDSEPDIDLTTDTEKMMIWKM